MNVYWRFIFWRQSWSKVMLNQTIHRSLASLCCITKDEIGVAPKGTCNVMILPHSVTWKHSLTKCWHFFLKWSQHVSLNAFEPEATCSIKRLLIRNVSHLHGCLTGYVFTCSDFSALDYGDLEAVFLKAFYQILIQIYFCAKAMFNFLIHLCWCTALCVCQYFLYCVSLSACTKVLDRNLV